MFEVRTHPVTGRGYARPIEPAPRRDSWIPAPGWLERREARTAADYVASERIGREIEEAENA